MLLNVAIPCEKEADVLPVRETEVPAPIDRIAEPEEKSPVVTRLPSISVIFTTTGSEIVTATLAEVGSFTKAM